MSEELQSMVQIIELYGRGLGALGRAIRFSAKGAARGVDAAKVKRMQHRMKLHYASTGNHRTMKLSDLEKLTGGQYGILNIPLEDEKELLGFYDRLKKLHVSFAELPDLQLGDGYTQIAYNPTDVESIKTVVKYYRKILSEMPEDISFDQYMDMAGKDGKALLDELAQKGYTDGMHIEQLEEIQSRIKSQAYVPFSLNMEKMLIQEEKDAYIFRLPRSRMESAFEHAIVVPKKDCLLLDGGQTLVSYLKCGEQTAVYGLDSKMNLNTEHPIKMKNEDLREAFAPLGKERLREIERLKAYQAEIFPSFKQGQESSIGSSAPFVSPEDTMKEILKTEMQKERQADREYTAVSFDRKADVVAESKNIYAVKLPKESEDGEGHLRCMIVDKNNTRLSNDGGELTVYLKNGDSSEVIVFDGTEKKSGEFRQSNQTIAANCLKQQENTRKPSGVQEMIREDMQKIMPQAEVVPKGISVRPKEKPLSGKKI